MLPTKPSIILCGTADLLHQPSVEVLLLGCRRFAASFFGQLNRLNQCFGSGSGWIRVFFADPDLGFKSPDSDPSIYKLMCSK